MKVFPNWSFRTFACDETVTGAAALRLLCRRCEPRLKNQFASVPLVSLNFRNIGLCAREVVRELASHEQTCGEITQRLVCCCSDWRWVTCATARSPGEDPDGLRKAALTANNIAQPTNT